MTTTMSDDELLELLERATREPDPAHDIEKHATVTREDAYRLQLKRKALQAMAGNPHVGYRVSNTSRTGLLESAVLGLIPQEAVSVATPIFTSLSASNIGSQEKLIQVGADRYGYVEAEVGVLIASRLEGPNVTPAAALAAIAGFLPAIDLAQIQKQRPYGLAHSLATMCGPHDTTVVFGNKLTQPSVDLILEGILVSVNGDPRASATAWESLGNPVNAVAWLANQLATVGAALEPGQLLVTGVCPYPQRLAPGDSTARADFTNLGAVSVRLSVAADTGENL